MKVNLDKKIAEKLKIPKDWVDATKEYTKKQDKAKKEINMRIQGLTCLSKERVVPL